MERFFTGGSGAASGRAAGPIVVETAAFAQVVEPVAYNCMKFILVREGASVIHSKYGLEHTRECSLVVVCAATLCGAIPAPRVRVTTAYVNLDYLLDQLTWRLHGLLVDRHEAESIAARGFHHNLWATRLPAETAESLGGYFDQIERLNAAEHQDFYAVQALFAAASRVLVPLMPYRDIPDGPVRSLAAGVAGAGGRFTPLRPEIIAVDEALRAALARRWTIAELADIAHLSPRQLGRVFASSYGQSPIAYLGMLRAKEMARLLREDPVLSVEAIGRSVGWVGRSHARDMFIRLLGIAPEAYRAAARGLDSAMSGPDTAMNDPNASPHP